MASTSQTPGLSPNLFAMASPPSLASQLPQITLCGSRACPRWQHRGPAVMSNCLHRWQASSHRSRGAAPLHPLWEPGLPAMAAPRSGSHVELSASLASQLPQVPGSRTTLPFVGAGLARDGSTAVRQSCRFVCIAGKPAPTGTGQPHHSTLCGSRACPRWQHRGPAVMSNCLLRWQASSHKARALYTTCRSELARELFNTATKSSRASSLLQVTGRSLKARAYVQNNARL